MMHVTSNMSVQTLFFFTSMLTRSTCKVAISPLGSIKYCVSESDSDVESEREIKMTRDVRGKVLPLVTYSNGLL